MRAGIVESIDEVVILDARLVVLRLLGPCLLLACDVRRRRARRASRRCLCDRAFSLLRFGRGGLGRLGRVRARAIVRVRVPIDAPMDRGCPVASRACAGLGSRLRGFRRWRRGSAGVVALHLARGHAEGPASAAPPLHLLHEELASPPRTLLCILGVLRCLGVVEGIARHTCGREKVGLVRGRGTHAEGARLSAGLLCREAAIPAEHTLLCEPTSFGSRSRVHPRCVLQAADLAECR